MVVSVMVSFCVCPFFQRDVIDEILDLIWSLLRVFLPTLALSVSPLAISVCPHVCFILFLILISMLLR